MLNIGERIFMKIWAHRGCSQMYPENTLLAFEKAAAIQGLTGIELDIQLTRDGRMAVCHDERVDRTTNGSGELRNYTMAELKQLKIDAGAGKWERIPEIEEVLELLETRLKDELKLNIELKNSIFPYEGMEEKIIELVHRKGLQNNVIYSSFYAHSVERVKEIAPGVETGVLDTKVSDCLYKLMGGCKADALHPFWRGIDLSVERLRGFTVRAWLTGHLYPEAPTGGRLDLEGLEKMGITDVFLNEPEKYL